jgi:hypothetical protein
MGQDIDNKSTNKNINTNTNTNKNINTFDIINKFKNINKDEKMSILVGQVPEYTMYFKMLKMGIPKDAIKQKMLLNCIETRVIDYPETAPYITVLHYINNPQLGDYVRSKIGLNNNIPSPPPLFPISGISVISGISNISVNTTARVGLLNAINNSEFKLKKIDPKDKILNKLMNNNPSGMKVPSLMDIQGALAKLKKVDIDFNDI